MYLFTFPESSNALDPGYGLVGVDGAVVPLRDSALGQVDLSLKPDLHHVGGLGKGHGHCPRGAACEQPCRDSYICDLKIHKNNSIILNSPTVSRVRKTAEMLIKEPSYIKHGPAS